MGRNDPHQTGPNITRQDIKEVEYTQRKQMSHAASSPTKKQRTDFPEPTSNMSSGRTPYFIISALPADDMAQQELEVEQVFHLKAEEARDEIEKMKKSLDENGFDFDCMYPQGAPGRHIWNDQLTLFK